MLQTKESTIHIYETIDALIGDKVRIGLLVRGRDPGKEAGNSLGTIMVGTPGSIMNAILRGHFYPKKKYPAHHI